MPVNSVLLPCPEQNYRYTLKIGLRSQLKLLSCFKTVYVQALNLCHSMIIISYKYKCTDKSTGHKMKLNALWLQTKATTTRGLPRYRYRIPTRFDGPPIAYALHNPKWLARAYGQNDKTGVQPTRYGPCVAKQ